MLWLKAWLETRWRLGWAFLVGLLFFAMPLIATQHVPASTRQVRLSMLTLLVAQASFLATIMLAGSGIHTASTRPGASDKGADRSLVFTLALPVTRLRLFLVRTAAGMLESMALLTLFFVGLWSVWPQLMSSPSGALGYFAVVASCSLAAYAISACLSTFCDEGARIRGSVLVFVVPSFFILSARRPPTTNIFTSMLAAHQLPWATIGAAIMLTLLGLAAAVTIIQTRDY